MSKNRSALSGTSSEKYVHDEGRTEAEGLRTGTTASIDRSDTVESCTAGVECGGMKKESGHGPYLA